MTKDRPAADPNSKPHATLPHLFLFVACCGVYLASARMLDREALQAPTLLGMVVLCAHGLCVAAAWTGLVLFVLRAVRGARWPIEPGFKLAAILGARLALEVLLSLPSRALFQSTEALLDVTTCLLLVCTFFGKMPIRWQIVMTCLLALYGLPLLAMFVNGPRQWLLESEAASWVMQFGRPLMVMLLLTLALFLDRRQAPRPTWLHGLGSGLWIYYSLLAACFWTLG